jgi:hypothetical protein
VLPAIERDAQVEPFRQAFAKAKDNLAATWLIVSQAGYSLAYAQGTRATLTTEC